MKCLLLMNLMAAWILATACFAMASEPATRVPEIEIDVNVDIDGNTLHGTAAGWIPELLRLEFSVADIDISSITLDGHDIRGAVGEDEILRVGPLNNRRKLVICFSKTFTKDMEANGNHISNNAAVLLEGWYPRFLGTARYNLRASLPSRLVAVSEADSIRKEENGDRTTYHFIFPYPREDVTLVAGPFVKNSFTHRGVEVETYFFPENQALADRYLKKLCYYLDLYADILPPYPFKRFAVVENILPTGFGMSTYTLLGSQVIRLPFIVDTSLGHEFVHSWFGNSVYVDSSRGNWCEGLTTFLADAMYKEKKGLGINYRHNTLVEYQAWVHKNNAIPVSQFHTGSDRATRAVGYGKAAMIFHMLKKEVGQRTFSRAVSRLAQEYRFRTASWETIQDLFEQEARINLDWFFSQWLQRNDVPALKFSKITVEDGKGRRKIIKFTVEQTTETPYRLPVRIMALLPGKAVVKNIRIEKKITEVSFQLPATPYGITADPDFDLMRKLSHDEFPPVLARVLGAEKKFYTVADEEKEKYESIIKFLKQRGFMEKKPGGHGHNEFKEGAFAILGKATGGMKMFAGNTESPENGVIISVRPNPFGTDSVVCTIQASSAKEMDSVISKLPHYGKYTMLKFTNGKIEEKSTAPAAEGIRLEINRGITAIAAKDIFPVKKIVRYISGDRVVYVSEQHDQAAHHTAQLKIIKLLHERGVKLAVGMEMFQRPFQKALDSYMAGTIDERGFLRESEYFKRWGFDYHLYRPIVEYCRDNGIPIVALNIPREISTRIAREGIAGLSKDEKASLPREIDDSNRRYREHLQDIFKQHGQSQVGSFEYFFQAQLSWDETMAETVSNYLAEHPDESMVVLAGAGHIAYGFGIPSRVARRMPGIEYSIVVNDPGDDMVPEAGDFFLFPPSEQVEKAPKLGVVLTDKDGRLEIKQVMPGSPADKGGIKAGDVLVSFEGHPLHDINDLKIELYFKGLGERAKLTVERDGITREIETGPLNSSTFSFGSPHGSGMEHGMSPHTMKHGKP